jgi:hypothetical protein
VAHCENITCTAATTSTLDTAENVGSHNSITIGADDLPIISYADRTNHQMKVAHCNDLTCTTATVTAIPSAGYPYYTSIAIGTDGLPVISFFVSDWHALKVAHCENITCTSSTVNLVDGSVSQYHGIDSELTIGVDGLPIISYYVAPADDLLVAHCNDAACTSAITTTLDSAGNVGSNTSITIGNDGLPIISYRDHDTPALKVAHCENITCTAATTSTLDTSEDTGWLTSIIIGADGNPLIGYDAGTPPNAFLKVAHCNDPACTGASIATVATSSAAGFYPELTIGMDNLPFIAYLDFETYTLNAAHCANIFCTPYFRRR